MKVDLLLPELDVPLSGGGKSPGERPVSKAAEEKVADLERRLGAAETAGQHKDVAVEALVLLEQAVAAKSMDYAARLADMAFAAAQIELARADEAGKRCPATGRGDAEAEVGTG